MGSALVWSLWIFLLTAHRQLCGGFLFAKQQIKEESTSSPSARLRPPSKDVTQRVWYSRPGHPSDSSFSFAGSSLPFHHDSPQGVDEATDMISLQDFDSSDFHDFSVSAYSQLGAQEGVSRKTDLVRELLQSPKPTKHRNEASSVADKFPRKPWPPSTAGDNTDKTDRLKKPRSRFLLQSIENTWLSKRQLPSDTDNMILDWTFPDERGVHRRMMRNSEILSERADNSGASFLVSKVNDSFLSSEHTAGPSRPAGRTTDGAEGTDEDDKSDGRRDEEFFADMLGDEPASDDTVNLSSFLVMSNNATLAAGSTSSSTEPLPVATPAPTRHVQVPTPAPTPKPWPRLSSNPTFGETTVYAVPTPLSEQKTTSFTVGVGLQSERLFAGTDAPESALEGGSAAEMTSPAPLLAMLPPVGAVNDIGSTACQQPIIVNGPIPCGRRRRRNTPLTSLQLSALLRQLGGSDSSSFTAVNIEEASQKFRNMLPLGIPDKDVYLYEKYSTSELQKILEKYYATRNSSAADAPGTWKQVDENTSASDWHNASRQFQKRLPSGYQDAGGRDALYGLPWLRDVDFPVEFLQLMVPAGHVVGRRARVVKRAAETYEGNYCTSTTEEIPGGFLNLCSACQVTTSLGDDVFPRVLNEVVCNPANEDNRCLSFQGATHGSCDQTYLHVQMLRRQPGRCMKITLNGQTMLTDRWELYSQQVRIGCECKMDKRSPLLTGGLVG